MATRVCEYMNWPLGNIMPPDSPYRKIGSFGMSTPKVYQNHGSCRESETCILYLSLPFWHTVPNNYLQAYGRKDWPVSSCCNAMLTPIWSARRLFSHPCSRSVIARSFAACRSNNCVRSCASTLRCCSVACSPLMRLVITSRSSCSRCTASCLSSAKARAASSRVTKPWFAEYKTSSWDVHLVHGYLW